MRVGKADQQVIWQGGKPHGQQFVGLGIETFARVGCVVTSVAMALRLLGAKAGAMPLEVQNKGLMKGGVWAKNSSACSVRALIDSQGSIISGQDFPGPGQHSAPDAVLRIVEKTIESGGVCLLHVDHDSAIPGGDQIGDHWIVAYAFDADHVYCADPATARNERLRRGDLSGIVMWGKKQRAYSARRVVSVFVR